jgi:hypothetical protein
VATLLYADLRHIKRPECFATFVPFVVNRQMNESSSQPQLYAPRTQIYPRSVRGRYRNLKWGVLFLAYGVYFLLPWLRWERNVGPDQADRPL